MAMGTGKVGGNICRTWRIASIPPAEAPITTRSKAQCGKSGAKSIDFDPTCEEGIVETYRAMEPSKCTLVNEEATANVRSAGRLLKEQSARSNGTVRPRSA